MNLAFRYPVVARCVPKGKTATRVGLFYDVSQFSVRSLPSDQFTKVLTYSESKERLTIFQSNDGYYRRVGNGKPSSLASPIRAFGNLALETLIRDAHAQFRKASKEEGIGSVHGAGVEPSSNRWEPVASFNGDIEWDDVGRWKLFAETHLSENVLLIDGEVFMKVNEPVICLKRASGGYQLQLSWYDHTVTIETTRYHFPLSALDLAADFADALSQATGIPVAEVDFEIINGDSSSDFAHRLDAGNCIKSVYNSLNGGLSEFLTPVNRTSGTPFPRIRHKSFDVLPDNLLHAFMTLRQVAPKSIYECGESELEAGMSAVDAVCQLATQKRWSWIISNPQSVKIHLEKWENRDVSVDLIASAPVFVH